MAPTDPSVAPPQRPVIDATGVQFAFGQGELRKQILFDIDFQVMPGEFLLLTGHSGSGKTTLLTLIGALRRVESGQLTVLGRGLHEASDDDMVSLRRDIGFIFQNHNLLEFLTAIENVAMPFQLHPELSDEQARERAGAILTEVGLGEHLNYHPSRLSGGQKQRVAIARALVTGPKLILADEPTASLDSQSGRDVVSMLHRMAKESGCPVLMVTHDNRVLDFADRIINMEDGRIGAA